MCSGGNLREGFEELIRPLLHNLQRQALHIRRVHDAVGFLERLGGDFSQYSGEIGFLFLRKYRVLL